MCEEFEIHWKLGKTHVVPHALPRLPNDQEPPSETEDAVLNSHDALVQMTDDFYRRCWDGYQKEPARARIAPSVDKDSQGYPDRTGFIRDGGLIYQEQETRKRLCIPLSIPKENFHQVHDAAAHAGFHRAFERINEPLFIRNCAKQRRIYIRTYSTWEKRQTLRHKPHGQMVQLTTPLVPFHAITMDLATALPAQYGKDTLLTGTDKFTKIVALIPGAETWNAERWGEVFVSLLFRNWVLQTSIISDKDPRILGDFWEGAFRQQGMYFLTSFRVLPADGQPELNFDEIQSDVDWH